MLKEVTSIMPRLCTPSLNPPKHMEALQFQFHLTSRSPFLFSQSFLIAQRENLLVANQAMNLDHRISLTDKKVLGFTGCMSTLI